MRGHSFKKISKSIYCIIVVMLLILSSIGNSAFAESKSYLTKTEDTLYYNSEKVSLVDEYKNYLKYTYDITVPDIITQEYFINTIQKILDIDYSTIDTNINTNDLNKRLTYEDAISITVKAADLKELAYTYPETKVKSTLLNAKISSYKSEKVVSDKLKELAVAIDTQIIPLDMYSKLAKLENSVDSDFTTVLLGKLLTFRGQYKNYLGNISDPDIYSKVYKSWKSQNLLQADDLRNIVDQALKEDIITGYNVKDIRYNPNFDPELSITYGHTDINHALQLIGLLKSEGIDAKVQLEPKSSAFIYLKEWGEPEEFPDYQVVQIENGNYIAYSKEYDISFEFNNKEQKNMFQDIIFSYAKRDQEDMSGLIIGSWWQPLYYSLTNLENYEQITNNYVEKDNFIAQSFSLNDKSNEVVEGFKKIDPNIKVTTYKFWVDKPFYNYLMGDYK